MSGNTTVRGKREERGKMCHPVEREELDTTNTPKPKRREVIEGF